MDGRGRDCGGLNSVELISKPFDKNEVYRPPMIAVFLFRTNKTIPISC
jgi:hypothetical protein